MEYKCWHCTRLFKEKDIIITHMENEYYPENGIWMVAVCKECYKKKEVIKDGKEKRR